MGCDIHWIIERKNPETGNWVGIATDQHALNLPRSVAGKTETNGGYDEFGARNYALFAAIAGVRGEGPDALGLPPDASELSLMYLPEDDSGLHSHSYCSLETYVKHWHITRSSDEDVDVQLAAMAIKGEQFQHPIFSWIDDEEGREAYRVVFAFDN